MGKILILSFRKKAEILDKIRDGKKVRLNWLATVCMVSEEEILEVANEYKILVEEGYLIAPEDEMLLEKLDEIIERGEEEELIGQLKKPTLLEHELPYSSIMKIEEIFRKEGFKYSRKEQGKIAPIIVSISKDGIKITQGNKLIYETKWHETRNILLTEHREKEYKLKRDHTKDSDFIALVELIGFSVRPDPITPQPPFTYVQSRLTQYNTLLITSKEQDDFTINTSRFRSLKKIPFPKEYDSLIYIIQHFFHKMKRKQYGIESPELNETTNS